MKLNKTYQRRVVSRSRHKARSGFHWKLVLDCRHVVKLGDLRGKSAVVTHCEKCSLGLVAA